MLIDRKGLCSGAVPEPILQENKRCMWLFDTSVEVKGCAWEYTVDQDEDSSSCKSSAALFSRKVSTLAERVVLSGQADENKGSCCVFL